MSTSQTDDANRYVHQPLDHARQQIRLIHVERMVEGTSSSDDSPVECTIKIVDLEDSPPFTALSYMWGSPEPAHKILIDGKEMTIRENLLDFLSEFRKMTTAREHSSDDWLWIDQITIDQSNMLERGQQVQMMGSIYLRADSVIAWLGRGDGRGNVEPRSSSFRTDYESAKHYRQTGDRVAFFDMLCNAYFERLWVIQEFLLARRVRLLMKDVWLYDEDTELDDDTLHNHTPARIYDLLALRKRGVGSKHFCTLDYSLGWFGFNSKCEKPHDKIYGLLGLVEPSERLVVDYSKSPQQVLVDACLAVFLLNPILTTDEATWTKQYVGSDYKEWLKVEMGNRHLPFSVLSRAMGFTEAQTATVKVLFHALWMRGNETFACDAHGSHVTAIGFEEADAALGRIDRWWFDYKGERYYMECHLTEVVDFRTINAKTGRLLYEHSWGRRYTDTTWETYLSWTDTDSD